MRAWQPTPLFLPGESHGQRKLTGFHSVAKSNTTEATWHTRYLKFYFLYKSNASSPKEDKNEWKSFSAIRVFVISLYPFFFKFDAF